MPFWHAVRRTWYRLADERETARTRAGDAGLGLPQVGDGKNEPHTMSYGNRSDLLVDRRITMIVGAIPTTDRRSTTRPGNLFRSVTSPRRCAARCRGQGRLPDDSIAPTDQTSAARYQYSRCPIEINRSRSRPRFECLVDFLSISLDAIQETHEHVAASDLQIIAESRWRALCRRFRARPAIFRRRPRIVAQRADSRAEIGRATSET